MKECYIFGAGKWGEGLYRKLNLDPAYCIKGFIDNDKAKRGKNFCGQKIYHLSDISDKSVLIIIATAYFRLITLQLKEAGFTNLQSAFLCGDWETDKEYSYILYHADSSEVFKNCTVDIEKAKRIRNDFLLNYPSVKEKKSYQDSRFAKSISKDSAEQKLKTVLFIAYYFPPIGGSGVQRSIKFVKYLYRLGYKVIVLTTGQYFDSDNPRDGSFLCELPQEVEVIRIDEKYAAYDQMDEEGRQEIYNLFLACLYDSGWYKKFSAEQGKGAELVPQLSYEHFIWVNECLKSIDSKIDMSGVDVIYTSASPFCDFVLGYFLKKKYGTPWVMDYRDGWASNDDIWNWYRKTWGDDLREQICTLEKEMQKNADGIVAVQQTVLDEAKSIYGVECDNTSVILNGYDEDDFADIGVEQRGQHSVFTICHNGDINPDQEIELLVKIITDLIQEGKIKKNKIQIIVNGKMVSAIERKVKEADEFHIVVKNGRKEHKESIRDAVGADLLLLLVQRGDKGKTIYTGKVFEYLRMGIPILAFAPKTSVLEKLIAETATGRTFDYDEMDQVSAWILAEYDRWKEGSGDFRLNMCLVESYSRRHAAEKLAAVFEKCVKD